MLSNGLAANGEVVWAVGTAEAAANFSLTAFFSLLGLEVLLVEAPSDESDESPEADDDPDDEEEDEEVGSSLIVEFRSRMDLF